MKRYRLTTHPGVVQCKTDPQLEQYLCRDGNDPGLSVQFLKRCVGNIEALLADVKTFRGNSYVPYSAIVERAKTVPSLRALVP